MTPAPFRTRMKRIFEKLKRFFQADAAPLHTDEDVERLRLAFKGRYHHFKLLLNANQRSLEIMADIEQALRSRPFGMTFVRSACTGIAVNVLKMIKNMEQLAPGKYPDLRSRYEVINQRMQTVLSHKNGSKEEALILHLSEIDRSKLDLVGGKMAGLAEIRNRLSIQVPEGFVITTYAYDRFLSSARLQEEIDRLFQYGDEDDLISLYSLSARIQQLILKTPVPDAIVSAIHDAWKKLEACFVGKKLTAAMRSSSLFEDTAGASFAGQFRTELNVSYDSVLTAYKEVVASKYSVHAITYRLAKGFSDEDIAVAVGCVAMVDAAAGGVAYSVNPVNEADDAVHISAVWGLPKAVVDGSTACDQFIVHRFTSDIRSVIGKKETYFVCYPEEGLCKMAQTGEKAGEPSLTIDQILTLKNIVLKLEAFFKTPVDVEWAVASGGGIVIVQCRPMKHVSSRSEPKKILEGDVHIVLTGGVTASPGICSGQVFFASKSMDSLKFPDGGILVVRQPLPQWASLISRAAGVVAEQGGMAGHLANVAREFGVPALFGCPDAVQKLSHCREVTLDADSGVIYEGRQEDLLDRGEPIVHVMTGSPVYKILAEAGKHITPLNLLDPASPKFRPSGCETFHDLTRFIHEKSVHEMFNFGHEHRFSERSGKQLFFNVPMQWWVLNLDDGFTEEIRGKYVRLEQIKSIPMRAFWDGFIAVPWDGPPALDRRGFASVLFQSTADPALAAGVKSRYTEKNYFMISRHFCNLNSRLGYHFSVMEALVSDRAPENYVSFQFQGGAADSDRRLKRVRFLGDILEAYDFRVEIREDSLIARIENFDCNTMQKRIKILGHLSLHTRQLDMIMARANSVNYFRLKIHKDLEYVLSLPVETPPVDAIVAS